MNQTYVFYDRYGECKHVIQNGVNFWVKGRRKSDPAQEYEMHVLDGKVHRVGGPALIIGDVEYWIQYDLVHREDGPAIVDFNANRFEWYWGGDVLFFSEWVAKTDLSPPEITQLMMLYTAR